MPATFNLSPDDISTPAGVKRVLSKYAITEAQLESLKKTATGPSDQGAPAAVMAMATSTNTPAGLIMAALQLVRLSAEELRLAPMFGQPPDTILLRKATSLAAAVWSDYTAAAKNAAAAKELEGMLRPPQVPSGKGVDPKAPGSTPFPGGQRDPGGYGKDFHPPKGY